MPTLDLNDRDAYPLSNGPKNVWVWTRSNWSDPWIPRPELLPTELSWGIAPTIDAAAFTYHYGNHILPGSSRIVTYAPLSDQRLYILVRFDTDDGDPLDWLGITDPPVTETHYPARQTFAATGTQILRAGGFLRSLTRSPILSTVHETAASGDLARSPNVGATFNATPKGNCTLTKKTLTIGDGVASGSAYAFADINNPLVDTWSTRDIVEHLCTFQLPTPAGSRIEPTPDGEIPWALGDLSALPTWDSPRLETDGRTTADLLNTLIRPSKLLGYRVRPVITHPELDADQTPHDADVDPPTVDSIELEFFTTTPTEIDLPGIGTLPAAATIHDIEAVSDPKTVIRVTEDVVDSVDQIQIRGPREIGVATFQSFESELVPDWSGTEKNLYAAAASTEDGYSDWSPSEQRRANERVRNSTDYRHVYRRFRLRDNWDGTVFGGDPVFYRADDDTEPHAPYNGLLEILDTLPLYQGVDYSVAIDEVDESGGLHELDPLVTMRNPQDLTYERIDALGTNLAGDDNAIPNLRPFSIAFSVAPPLAFNLTVSGAPQHAIDKNFSALDVDPVQTIYGGYDYTLLNATLALRGNRRPAVHVPASTTRPVVERKIIDLDHPALQMVYLSPQTTVDIDPLGTAILAPGGLLRDPMPTLNALAEIVADHVLAPRRRVELITPRRLGGITPGDLLATVDTYTQPINAPIHQIRITFPITKPTETAQKRIETTITAASYTANITDLIG